MQTPLIERADTLVGDIQYLVSKLKKQQAFCEKQKNVYIERNLEKMAFMYEAEESILGNLVPVLEDSIKRFYGEDASEE